MNVLPDTSDYLTWARQICQTLLENPQIASLSSSSAPEPTGLLHADIREGYAEGRLGEPLPGLGWGDPALARAVADEYRVDPGQILLTSGCSNGLLLVCRAFLSPGDEALVELPRYQPLALAAEAAGASVSAIERRGEGYEIDLDELQAKLTPRTKLITLANLHNPTGALLDDDFLLQLAAIARSRGIRVAVDEVYGDLASAACPGAHSGPAARLDDCFISLNSLTKVYGLQALRCGWILASEDAIRHIRPVYAVFETGVSCLTHAIARIVFSHLDRYRAPGADLLERNRPQLAEFAKRLGADGLVRGEPPRCGCLYFPRMVAIDDTLRLAEWLVSEHRVLVTPGEFFSAPGYVRLSCFAGGSDFGEALSRLEEGLRAYPGRGHEL